MSGKGLTYGEAGVDIDAGNRMVELIKPLVRATARPGADAEIGGFGGLFDLARAGFKDPVLVAATDGVGTKVKIAIETGRHDTIGIDLVAMSVNDLVVQGAEPLFFLDYFACSKLDPETGATVVAGIAEGCRLSGCALIGGETAEMPGLYQPRRLRPRGLCGRRGRARHDPAARRCRSRRRGDRPGLLGRAFQRLFAGAQGGRALRPFLGRDPAPFDPAHSLGEALLKPTRLYVKSCLAAIRKTGAVKALAHITGGGFPDNIPRALPKDARRAYRSGAGRVLPVFQWLAQTGGIADAGNAAHLQLRDRHDRDRRRRTRRMRCSTVLREHGETATPIGEVVPAQGEERVTYRGTLDLAL